MTQQFSFDLSATDGRARTGKISTPRGDIRTPAFMPVGTAATVKAMMPESVRATGADILLGNTYHLMLRPTAERIAALGGLHKFMNWERPILTDSGGFQVMSLAGLRSIQQGGLEQDFRAESAAALREIGFEGYAVGGLAVGEGQEAMFGCLDYAPEQLPADKPRYLMGVGKPDDLVGAVARGIDMFDCVLPSRSGRTGQVFTRRGVVNIKNARHMDDPRPLDEDCACPACSNYSRAYLHHVFKAQEMISGMLLTWHNLHYYQELMAGMRAAIAQGRFAAFQAEFHAARADGDIEPV